MAFVVARPRGGFEIRESTGTPSGPRSRTLATFRVLTRDVLDHAQKRAGAPLDEDQLIARAAKVGAVVACSEADSHARKLLGALSRGDSVTPAVASLLGDVIGASRPVSDSVRAAAGWLAATTEERAAALVDLLLLADRLPASSGSTRSVFPRLESALVRS